MALQGGIDSFPFVDVLRLLGSTNKSGRLDMAGDRGVAKLWMVDGMVVAVDSTTPGASDGGHELVDVVFEMMRFVTGDFTFVTDEAHDHPVEGVAVEDLIAQSVEMMEEWLEIADSLPSMDNKLRVAPTIDEDVHVTPDMWKALQVMGPGMSVKNLIDECGWGELPALRVSRVLLDSGLLVVLDEAEELLEQRTESAPTPQPEVMSQPATSFPLDEGPFGFERDSSAGGAFDRIDEAPVVVQSASTPGVFAPEHRNDHAEFSSDPGMLFEPAHRPEADEAFSPERTTPPAHDGDDLAAQVASLSPEAARAVAAASAGNEDEERARVLKFLGSV